MLNVTLLLTVIIIALALAFDFINGFHDTANAIATSVSTRVLSMRLAVLMSAVLNFAGAFMNEKVAKTIGNGLVAPGDIPQKVIIVTLISAIVWNLLTWYYGIPSSSSHALIGSLLGAAIAFKGSLYIVNWHNFFKTVVLWLFLSTIIGFLIGYLFMVIIQWIFRKTRPSVVTKIFSKAQIFSAMLMALNHGSNDAQKSMGIITMALVSGGLIQGFHVQAWVKALCALAMALGTSFGGYKIIKTMGMNMARLAPVNGFAAETGAAAVIFTASMLSAPVSTTHTISTSIMGVAASKRLSSVRWVVAKNIIWAWVLTIPICAGMSALILTITKLF
ncbi:MAG: inorganic phosphate transporter [Bacillota bacterium]|nr:inorganic phosphate transporter [Bacillota bacterium]